ncbi:MAG: hypothetical protein QXZ70_09050, partial [Candidatus Bathyarchaeia archaeon]
FHLERMKQLNRLLKFNRICPITHIALDAINRSEGDVEIEVSIEAEHEVIVKRLFKVHYWTNRRLLVPIPKESKIDGLNIILRIKNREEPVKIILDNLRGFA